MAKLSVYNTIDRSQLGGKFVPLIQSGVSNYKILASDLGKEYHPGDAIEITDTGEINVKFSPGEFEIVNSYLSINPDDSRGVFNGSNGLYIASANNSIDISSNGIKVNPEALAGPGLHYHYDKSLKVFAIPPLSATNNGVELNLGDGGGLKVHDNSLWIDKDYISQYATVRAGHGLYWYRPGYPESALYVQSANSSILVGESGLSVHACALIDNDYLSITPSHVITVDTASVARAITGSGLVTTNGAIGVNVNTATGIIVKDNRLYLNAGVGLHTTNNTVRVKKADDTIDLSSSGIKVNAGYGLSATEYGLRVKPADSSIDVIHSGIKVNIEPDGGLRSGGLGLYIDSSIIPTAPSLAGTGLGCYDNDTKLYIKSADNTITVGPDGIKVNPSALSIPTASSLVGSGLTSKGLYLYVQSADGSIGVGVDGIKVNVKSGGGISVGDQGLYIHNTSSSSGIEGVSVYTDGGSSSASRGSISIGGYSSANGENSVVIGKLATTGAYEAVIIGYCASAHSTSYDNIAVGSESYSRSSCSIAIGSGSKSYSYSSIAIGRGSVSTGDNSIAIGDLSNTFSAHSIAIGSESYAYSASSIAIGLDSTVKGPNSIAIGSNSYADSASSIAIGYSSSSGANSVAIGAGSSAPNTYCLSAGYMSLATGSESVALGVNSDAGSFGVAIGSQSNASQYGLAIGYNASALDGMVSIRTSHSDGRCFDYKYDCEGKLYATDSSGGTYTRSWENLLTPPDYSTAVSINANTEYTADRPTYISFNVYAGGTGGYVVAFIKNSVTVCNVAVLYGLTIYNIIPVSKGDTYKLQVTNQGAINPQIYAYRIYPQ